MPDLIATIEDYLSANNADRTPFVRTETAESILAKATRARRKLEEVVGQSRDGPLTCEGDAPGHRHGALLWSGVAGCLGHGGAR